MFNGEIHILTDIIPLVLFLFLFGGNYFYQTRARKYVDEFLRDNPKEFNKQITANAYIYLFGRGLLGVLFILVIFYYKQSNAIEVLDFWTIVNILFGTGFIFFGIWGFSKELERKIENI